MLRDIRDFPAMNAMSRIVKRSLRIAGHATSISLEEPFWRLLRHVAAAESLSIAALVEAIDRERRGINLSSAVRIHLLEWMMLRSRFTLSDTEEGNVLAGEKHDQD
jgi:predicted DNA-binding ribbon-helix-helix protein